MGLAPSTRRTYRSGQERYLTFCRQTGTPPLPVCEQHLCRFCAYLADENLCLRTVKVYLAAVRYMQIAADHPAPVGGAKREYVLRGIKKNEAVQQKRPRERLQKWMSY